MKACVVSADDPWGASHGGTLRTRAIIEAMAAVADRVDVCFLTSQSEYAQRNDNIRLVPVHAAPAGERRLLRPIGRVKRAFLPLPTMTGVWIGPLIEAVQSIGDIDVLAVSQLRLAPYSTLHPGTSLWLDLSDLWSEMLRPEVEGRHGPFHWTANRQLASILEAERHWIGQSRVVTAAGHHDARTAQTQTGVQVDWLPTPVQAPKQDITQPTGPPTIGLFGNFAFWPNRDAYSLFAERWVPRLRRLGWECVVAGYEASSLPPDPAIRCLGTVGAPQDFYAQVHATAAPIRLGAGVKVKALESIVHGRPVLGTAFAFQGLSARTRHGTRTITDDGSNLPSPAELPPIPAQDVEEVRTRFSANTFRGDVSRIMKRLR